MTVATRQESPSVPNRRGRFTINLIANLANFLMAIFVGLWFSPYVIRHLGVAAYGLIPLTANFASYLNLLTLGVNYALGRNLTIALERDDHQQANRIFNTALFANIAIAGIVAAIGAVAVTHTNALFSAPAGQESAARWLLASTIALFLLTSLSYPCYIAAFCRNRFDLRNMVDISAIVIKIGLMALLFNLTAPKLVHVSVSIIAGGLVILTGSILVCRRLLPMLRVRPSACDRGAFAQLTHIGRWIILEQIGALFFLNTELLVVNRLFGPQAGGQYAVALQFHFLIRGLALAVAAIFEPTIMALYARQDIDGLIAYTRRAVKLLGIALALPIGLAAGLAAPALTIWQGPRFAVLAPLVLLILAPLVVNYAAQPLFTLLVATTRVRIPGIAACALGVTCSASPSRWRNTPAGASTGWPPPSPSPPCCATGSSYRSTPPAPCAAPPSLSTASSSPSPCLPPAPPPSPTPSRSSIPSPHSPASPSPPSPSPSPTLPSPTPPSCPPKTANCSTASCAKANANRRNEGYAFENPPDGLFCFLVQ